MPGGREGSCPVAPMVPVSQIAGDRHRSGGNYFPGRPALARSSRELAGRPGPIWSRRFALPAMRETADCGTGFWGIFTCINGAPAGLILACHKRRQSQPVNASPDLDAETIPCPLATFDTLTFCRAFPMI